VTVHWRIVTPAPSEVTVVVGEFGLVITGLPGPLTRLQRPVPCAGVFAAMVVEVTLAQNVWLGPAFETGAAFIVSVIALLAVVQGELPLAVNVRLTVPAVISAVLGVYTGCKLVGLLKYPVPEVNQKRLE